MNFEAIHRLWRHFLSDNLFRNSAYLMAATGVSAALGFFFWLICTHIFSPEDIGIGTALISAMSLISVTSLLGFNSTFVRILPTSTNRDNEINTGSLLVIGASAVMAAIYVWWVPFIAPSLIIIQQNFWYGVGFVVMVALASINSLTDSIFIAYRAAEYTLITDGVVTSGAKLLLPVVFLGLDAYGVFAAAGLAASIGMVASVIFLVWKFGYKPKLRIDAPTLKDVFHYSFTNYVANLFNMTPTLVLPIIVLDHLGAAAAGYYYLSFMVINLLYTVSNSVSQSLFAEGSYSDSVLRNLVKRSTLILVTLMIPACAILALFGPFVLDFFGKAYSNGGSSVIVLLAVSAPIISAYNMGSVILRITKQVYSLVVINFIYMVVIIGLAWLWTDRGLVWVATAWIVGNLVATILIFFSILYHHRQHLSAQRESLTPLPA